MKSVSARGAAVVKTHKWTHTRHTLMPAMPTYRVAVADVTKYRVTHSRACRSLLERRERKKKS